MMKHIDFGEAVERFFMDYLVRERGVSKNTVRSYRDLFTKLLEFFKEQKALPANKIKIEEINRENMVSFLNWLEETNSKSTCNQRLGGIRSFAKFMMYIDPMHLAQWKAISSIKPKRAEKNPLTYLTVEAIALILEQIDGSTLTGVRDLALLTLMYQSGDRVQEIANLNVGSIRHETPYVVQLFGKGSKKRIVPLSNDVVELVEKYMRLYSLDLNNDYSKPLFFNVWHERLSTAGIAYILKKYVDMARVETPIAIPKCVSPHVLRHSKAMHLLQAGVNLIYIRDILGHVSVTTTENYARVDSRQKREALENAYSSVGINEPEIKSWEKNPKLLDFLKNLTK